MTPTRYECDVAVVGAGPAGIAAGATAAESRARVIVIDEGVAPGGQIWRPSASFVAARRAREWIARLDASRASVLRSASVVDVASKNGQFTLRAESGGAPIEIACQRIVLATGARELFLPFPGWTLPNVMGIGAAQALLKAGTKFRGQRVVISGSGPLMLPVASSLARAGAKVVLVAEQAPFAAVTRYAATLWRRPSMLMQAATLRWSFITSRYHTGRWVTSAQGDSVLREVTVTDGKSSSTFACDVLCTGFGLVPNTELARLLGCAVARRFVVVNGSQATTVPGVYAAGEPTGIAGVDVALVEGEIAGTSAAGLTIDQRLLSRRASLVRGALSLERAFAPRGELRALARPDTIVCRCEDVQLGDLDPGWTARQAKLYTRAGMGACQGRVCGGALECVMGWSSDSVRPPIQPARVSTFATEFNARTDSSSTEQGVH